MPLVGISGDVPPPPPARKRAPSKTASSKSDGSGSLRHLDSEPANVATRVETLSEYAGIFQGVAIMFGQYADAETIDMHAPPFLTAVAKLGDVHPSFGEGIDSAKGFGPYVALFAAGAPMVLQFLANHGRIDAQRARSAGIQDPGLLATRGQTKVMNAQADIIREQREAQEAAIAAKQRRNEEAARYNALAEQLQAANV